MIFDDPPPTAGTTSQRVERKYPLCVAILDEVIGEVSRILPVYHFTGTHDWSSIRTTYLDSMDSQCYQEYLQDLPVRRKIRIRQYGADGKYEDVCWFELKLKNNSLSLKRRFCCKLEDAARFMQGQNILDRIGPQDGTDFRQAYGMIRSAIQDQRLVPMVRVDYDRISFQDPRDPTLRLTLDQRLRFCSASREFQGRLEGLVLEVKYFGDKPAWLSSFQQRLGIKRVLRYSKFGRAMKRLTKLREAEANL